MRPLLMALTAGVASLALAGCSGDAQEFVENPFFDFNPSFATYTGGVGEPSNPTSGVWRLTLGASTNSVLPAETINVVAFASSPTRTLLFTVDPIGRGNLYGEIDSNGNDLTIRLHQYQPSQDRFFEVFGEGTLDPVSRTVTGGTYDVTAKSPSVADRPGSGTWSLAIVGLQAPEFEALGSRTITGIDVLLEDIGGRGNNELYGTLSLTINGSTVTGTATMGSSNDETISVGTGTLNFVGNLDAANHTVNCTFTGVVGTVNATGTAVITIAPIGTTPLFSGDEVVSGIAAVEFDDNTNAFLAKREFKGTVGRSTAF